MRLFLALSVALLSYSWAHSMTAPEVDLYFADRWKQRGLTPSPLVPDALFLRRAWLDLAGTLPGVNDVLAFETDRDPRKRALAIERLMGDPRFAEAWADRFRALLLNEAKMAQQRRLLRPFDRWLAQAFAANTPYDKLVRQLVAGRGPTTDNPEASYVAQFRDNPEALTGHMAKTFLGVQIQCAQCHDHPFEKWSQKEFYGLHAFFARVKGFQLPAAGLAAMRAGRYDELEAMVEKGGKPEKNPGGARRKAKMLERVMGGMPPPSLAPDARMDLAFEKGAMAGRVFVVVDRPRGEAVLPDPKAPAPAKGQRVIGETIRPRFLDGSEPAWPDNGVNRRDELADWLTAKENPYLARALVNRLWAMLLGRALVTPVDNVANPDDKTHDPLLSRLAAQFVESGFDLKAMIKLIVSTSVYQLSIEPSANNGKDHAEFSRGSTRPLDPEQLFASLMQASGMEALMAARDSDRLDDVREKLMGRFAKIFENDSAGDEESFHGTLTQALFLMNGPAVNRATSAVAGSAVRGALDAQGSNSEGLERLYLAAFARRPTQPELAAAAEYLARKEESGGRARAESWSDLYWAMLTSAEFLVNH